MGWRKRKGNSVHMAGFDSISELDLGSLEPLRVTVISKLLPILCAAKNGNLNWSVGAKAFSKGKNT